MQVASVFARVCSRVSEELLIGICLLIGNVHEPDYLPAKATRHNSLCVHACFSVWYVIYDCLDCKYCV